MKWLKDTDWKFLGKLLVVDIVGLILIIVLSALCMVGFFGLILLPAMGR